MGMNLGVWIDHRKAVLVRLSPSGEEIEEIPSEVEKHVRASGGSRSATPYGPQDIAAGDRVDRKYVQHLNRFYDEVITHFDQAEAIFILGPGEAKQELEKRIDDRAMRGRIVAIESCDKMTTPQLAAKVRNYFFPQ
jgi:hypothetical protein